MIRRVIVTRPEEAASKLARALAERGIEAMIAPMLSIEPVVPLPVLPDDIQAVLATSANAIDGLSRMTGRRDIPVFAVGDATAATAEAAGFRAVRTASGAGADLAALVRDSLTPDAGALLWVAGDVVATPLDALLTADGFTIRRVVVYRSMAVGTLPPAAARAIRDGSADGVLFFSPRTAEAFARVVREGGLDRLCARMIAYCLSQAVADAASRLSWRAVRVAAAPTRDDLLDTLAPHTGAGA